MKTKIGYDTRPLVGELKRGRYVEAAAAADDADDGGLSGLSGFGSPSALERARQELDAAAASGDPARLRKAAGAFEREVARPGEADGGPRAPCPGEELAPQAEAELRGGADRLGWGMASGGPRR